MILQFSRFIVLLIFCKDEGTLAGEKSKMRRVLLFTILTVVFPFLNAHATQSNCELCKVFNNVEYKYISDINEQQYSVINSEDKYYKTMFVALEDNIDNSHTVVRDNNKNQNFSNSNIENLKDILEIYNNESLKSIAQNNIDIFSSFHKGKDGKDIFVPLGIFLYLNKKF